MGLLKDGIARFFSSLQKSEAEYSLSTQMIPIKLVLLSVLAATSAAFSEKFESALIEQKIPQIKNQILSKYTNLNSADIKFYNVNYFYNKEDLDAINVFTDQIEKTKSTDTVRIGFLISDKVKETADQSSKELSVSGVLVEASLDGEVKNIQKGEFSRRAYVKMDGTCGEYSQGGFSNDMALRYKNILNSSPKPNRTPNIQQIDLQKAHQDLISKAQRGEVQAQYALGKNYLNGFGCKKNEEEAKKWLKAAADQGSKGAEAELNKIEMAEKSATNPQQNP